MATQNLPDFIVIDDDPTNNVICRKNIQMTFSNADIRTFTNPVEGLAYLQGAYASKKTTDTILFLDINMPVLNGWEILERLDEFPKSVKEHFKIFILTSSINKQDKEKAENNPLVLEFISKPLGINLPHGIFEIA